MKIAPWLIYSLMTTLIWGIWGALIEIPEKAGFPATLGFIAWALSMILPCLFALKKINWKPEVKTQNIRDGLLVGLTGAGGQLLLFQALKSGPAYVVFPLVSMYPVLTIFLSMIFIHERATRRQWLGIVVALIAIYLLSYQEAGDGMFQKGSWMLYAILVFMCWGFQAMFFKSANENNKAESIFFYMTLSGLFLAPFAWWMTDFNQNINMGFKGPYLAFMIQSLNAIGALLIVYAFRYGKAIIVAPLTGLAPMITVIISLFIYGVVPGTAMVGGLIFSAIALIILSE